MLDIDIMLKDVKSSLTMLRDIQWAAVYHRDHSHEPWSVVEECPICDNLKREGHTDNCKLVKLIDRLKIYEQSK